MTGPLDRACAWTEATKAYSTLHESLTATSCYCLSVSVAIGTTLLKLPYCDGLQCYCVLFSVPVSFVYASLTRAVKLPGRWRAHAAV
eukprot:COSAG02_NODE_3559_length_6563_cov_4.152382_10_plen_87_part_00